LLHLPLKQLRLEDLRLLIGQGIGIPVLVPLAIEHVEAHPLAAGDFYPGDLLKQIMEVDELFWAHQPELRSRLVTALEGALARISKVHTRSELAVTSDKVAHCASLGKRTQGG
jgi:contact-dependent growth inhibition (CDI) system CdiI-like immunity protein